MAFTKFHPLVCQRADNLTRGDNSGKTRNMRRLFFHEESIHEVSRRYLEHEYIHTYIHTYVHTYGQAETNMPPHFFKVGGIKREIKMIRQSPITDALIQEELFNGKH